jgi:hypothetical protein
LTAYSTEIDRQANMYRSSIAIFIALAMATLFTALTEPRRGGESQLLKPDLSIIARTVSKGDRLDLHSAPVCSPKSAAPDAATDDALRHQTPPQFQSSARIVLVGIVD